MGNSIGSNISLGPPFRGHIEEYKNKVETFNKNTSYRKRVKQGGNQSPLRGFEFSTNSDFTRVVGL